MISLGCARLAMGRLLVELRKKCGRPLAGQGSRNRLKGMGALMNFSIQGPASYRNWRAFLDRAPGRGAVFEVPIYSDATVVVAISGGAGPYSILNGIPAGPTDAKLVLRFGVHLDPTETRDMTSTDTAGYTGAHLGDEIAALLSLELGVRLMAGDSTRMEHGDGAPPVILGDSRRPAMFLVPANKRSIVPRALTESRLKIDHLSTLPRLAPEDATALIRAARSYRDGMWIAEVEPELSWLLLISALEVASTHQQIEQHDAVDILRRSKPKLVKRYENNPELLRDVANELARELRATARFLEFMNRHIPSPPTDRPPVEFQLSWPADL